MATFSKEPLSGAIHGKGVLVAATTSPGTIIHTAQSSALTFDEIFLYAQNNHTADVQITIQWGGTSATDAITITIPYRDGMILIAPGLILRNSFSIRVYAPVANVITMFGYVNRMT